MNKIFFLIFLIFQFSKCFNDKSINITSFEIYGNSNDLGMIVLADEKSQNQIIAKLDFNLENKYAIFDLFNVENIVFYYFSFISKFFFNIQFTNLNLFDSITKFFFTFLIFFI